MTQIAKKEFIDFQTGALQRQVDILKQEIQRDIVNIQQASANMTVERCYDIIFIETYAKSIRDAYAKLCDLEERIAMLNQLSQLDD